MTVFALVALTVLVQNIESKQYQVNTKPIGLYMSQKACETAAESMQAGLPKEQMAVCIRGESR